MEIILVDCNYVSNEFAASYLMVADGPTGRRGMFVECNTNYAIPFLKQAAQKAGLLPEHIDGLVITHVHLDHAGGAGLFMREFPQAKLYAHPKAARHAIDPAKLIAGATAVYGEAFMQKMYGEILPCDQSRVVVLEDGDVIEWGKLKLPTRHVRGHANHHLYLIEPTTGTLFSGDSFGVSYPTINKKRGLVVIPSTSPTDFDSTAAIQTVEWIRDAGAKQVALTHYGFLKGNQIGASSKQLIDQLRFSEAMLKKIRAEGLDEDRVCEHIHDWTIQYFAQQGITLDAEDLKTLAIDFKVNAQGLVHAARKNS